MSIGQCVRETIDKMHASEPDRALFAICSAIEETATREFQKPGKRTYKELVKQNLGLITDIALAGRKILNLNLAYEHPKVKKTPEGLCPVEELFYHAVRCGLYHTTDLPGDIRFADDKKIWTDNGVLVLPSSLVTGLIVMVVAAPVNANESLTQPAALNIGSLPIPLSKLWGRRNELLWFLDVMGELRRLRNQAAADARA